MRQMCDCRNGFTRTLSKVNRSDPSLGPVIPADQPMDSFEGNIGISMADILIPIAIPNGIHVLNAMTGPREWRAHAIS